MLILNNITAAVRLIGSLYIVIYRVAEGAAGGGRQGERRERPGAAGEGPAGGLKGPQREPQWPEKGAKKGLKTGLQTK